MNNKHTSYEEIDNDKYEYHQNTLENSMNAMRLDGEKKTRHKFEARVYTVQTPKKKQQPHRQKLKFHS